MRPRRSSRPPSPDAYKRRADRHLDTRTGRAEPQSRREFTSSAGVGDLQTVGTGAGRLAQPHVTANVGDPPELFAAWRLGARKTTPTPPPPARRADRPPPGQVAQSRKAAKSSAEARALGTSRPSAPARDAQNHVCVAPTAGPTPNLSAPLRLCAKKTCLLYTSPSPRDRTRSRMPSSA